MSTVIRSAIVALTVVAGLSAAQAVVRYDSGRPVSTYDLSTQDGAQGLGERIERNSN
jgi:hypothetical protein